MTTNESRNGDRRAMVLERARANEDLMYQDRESLESIRRGEKGIPGPQVFAEAEARWREAEEQRLREKEMEARQTTEENQPREGV